MKVLFIGEGRHDIGDSTGDFEPRPAKGSIPTLARQVCPAIAEDSPALAWREVSRFHPDAKKHGFQHKVAGAILVSVRRFNCAGTVCVADQDRDPDRLVQLEAGSERGRKLFPNHPVACGVAVESVEAWTLGVPEAIAAELRIDPQAVRQEYPHFRIEELYEKSGKPEHRPKALLERIAALGDQEDCTTLREAVALRTDIGALEVACKEGFKPFADQLRSVLASESK
jgi:hypothetical protein